MSEAALPPGPGRLRALRFATQPFGFLDDCARDFGDTFTLRMPGIAPFVFTSDPEMIREIFAGDPEQLRAGEANAPLGAFMGAQSLILLDGARHLEERRLMLPPFHGERMQGYGDTIAAIADRIADEWKPGAPVRLHAAMQTITFEAILSTVFGLDEGPERERLRAALLALFRLFGSLLASLLGLPILQFELGGLSPWGKVVRLKREFAEVLSAEIGRRRGEASGRRTDILSMLLEVRDENGAPMSDEALRDEMLTMMLAGHETTAASLAWAFYWLLSHREVAERLREEAAPLAGNPRAVSQLPYLDAVVKEVHRLTPVVPNVGRRLQSTTALGAWTLPAGTLAAPCIYLAHRRADLWADPERFDPDRFVGARVNPSAFFPFGGGVRRCIGAAFATFETKVVLTRVLSRVKLSLAPGYAPKAIRSSIALAPSGGMPVMVGR